MISAVYGVGAVAIAALLYILSQRRKPYNWPAQTILITGGNLTHWTWFNFENWIGAQGIGEGVVKLSAGKGCGKIVIVDIKEPGYKLAPSK